MKKKALRKDFYMEIKKTLNRFVSITLIVALGVAFYSGIQSAAPDMRYSGDAYFDEHKLMDLKVVGTLGLTEDDVTALSQVDGVSKAEPGYMTDVLCGGETQKVLHIESISPTLNQLTAEEGRLPQKAGECFVDLEFLDKAGYQVGDTIEFYLEDEDDYILKRHTFTIVGAGSSPLYIAFSRGNTTLGNGELGGVGYVLEEDFDSEVYTQIYMEVKGARNLTAYTDAYDTLIETVLERVEAIAGERCEIRYQEVLDEANEKLAEAESELADGKAEGESELAEAESELTEGESELADGKQELADAKKEIEDAEKEIADGEKEIEENEATLAGKEQELADGKAQLEDGWAQLNSGKEELAAQEAAFNSQYTAAMKEITAGEAQIETAKEELEAGKKEYESGLAQYEAGLSEYQAGETEYASGLAEFETQKAAWPAQKAELETQKTQLTQNQTALESALSQLNEKLTELQSQQSAAQSKRDALQGQLDTLNGQISSLSQTIQSLESEQASLNSSVSSLPGTISGYESQIETLNGSIETLDTEISSLNSQISSLQAQIAKEQKNEEPDTEKIEAWQSEVTAAQNAADSKTSERSGLQAQKDSLQAQRDAAQAELDAANGRLSAIQEELSAANASLSQCQENAQSLSAGIATADAGLSELSSGISTIQSQITEQTANLETVKAGISQIETGISQGDAAITQAEQTLSQSRAQLDAAKQQLETSLTQLESAKAQIASGEEEIAENEEKLADAKKQLTDGQTQIASAKETLAASEQQLVSSQAEITSGEEQIADAKQQIADAKQELADGKQELADAKQEVEDGEKEIAENEEKLADGRKEYEDGLKEFEEEIADGEQKIADAKQEIADISEPEWTVSDRSDLPDNIGYGENADRMRNIGEVFPVIFFLVAALISLTTMTRMVEEERTQIGTLKALGYSKVAIASKYMGYALAATLTGSVLGVVFGEKFLPYVIVTAYKIMYQHMPNVELPYNMKFALIAIAAALVSTLGATFSACWRALASTPAVLMRPPAPKEGKRVFLERIPLLWKHLSFIWKSTVRNLFRYKKRFFMTVFGIGGCMALMIVGYGLRDSIMDIASLQFTQLQVYDGMVILDGDASDAEKEELEQQAEEDARVQDHIVTMLQKDTIKVGEKHFDLYVMVPETVESFETFVHFRSRTTGETYELTDEGAVLTEKIAKELGVESGDTIFIEDEDHGTVEVPVAAITENYLSHYVYLTPALYEQCFGDEPAYNEILYRVTEESADQITAVGEDLLDNEAALSISYTESLMEQVSEMLTALDAVMYVLIISAGLLAFVVLYNLNNININERRRELATIKVLGFYDGEVSAYVYRENILLTIIGIFAGAGMGKLLHQFTITTVEIDSCMFGRNINLPSYLIAAAFTAVFSIFVNVVMHFKLKKIDMVESLKSVE